MLLKRKIQNSLGYTRTGMVFFLIGICSSMIADGRLLGVLFTGLVSDEKTLQLLRVFADGFAIPMFFAAIFFLLRGVATQR
jgi:hypothetical protein